MSAEDETPGELLYDRANLTIVSYTAAAGVVIALYDWLLTLDSVIDLFIVPTWALVVKY